MLDGGGAAANGTIDANVTTAAATALTRRMAAQATVLLRNRPVGSHPVLPLSNNISVAVIGAAADGAGAIYGGGGSGAVVPKYAVSVLQALRWRLGDAVSYCNGSAAEAAEAAAAADVALVVLADTSSEGYDRSNLTLPPVR